MYVCGGRAGTQNIRESNPYASWLPFCTRWCRMIVYTNIRTTPRDADDLHHSLTIQWFLSLANLYTDFISNQTTQNTTMSPESVFLKHIPTRLSKSAFSTNGREPLTPKARIIGGCSCRPKSEVPIVHKGTHSQPGHVEPTSNGR